MLANACCQIHSCHISNSSDEYCDHIDAQFLQCWPMRAARFTVVIFPTSLMSNGTTLMPNSCNAGQCVLPDAQPPRGVELGHHLGRRPHYNTIWGGGLITMLRQPRPEPSARLPPLALLIFGRLSQSKNLVCRDTATQVALC